MAVRSKTALITGASSGIGYELALLFAREGYTLLLVARDEYFLRQAGETMERACGVMPRLIRKDLSLPNSPAELFDELQRQSIEIDVLVNNAGFGSYGPFAESNLETELVMMRLNMLALTQLTRLCLGGMLARGEGKILNVASTAGFQPGPLMAVYYATKAYVLSFSEALAVELRGSGVTLSALCPGPTRTGFRRRAGMEASRLFDFGVMDAATVAAAGYRGLMRNQTVIVPGIKNKLLAFSTRFSPRSLTPLIVRMMQDRSRGLPHAARG